MDIGILEMEGELSYAGVQSLRDALENWNRAARHLQSGEIKWYRHKCACPGIDQVSSRYVAAIGSSFNQNSLLALFYLLDHDLRVIPIASRPDGKKHGFATRQDLRPGMSRPPASTFQ